MSGWAAKRFWKQAQVRAVDGGYAIMLDERQVRTPAKALMVVPSAALAAAIAAEWEAQQGKIDPRSMPFTRSANAAIDKVGPQRAEVVDLLAAYGDADLICYRAVGPAELGARQAAAWDPLIDWAATALDVPLVTAAGVMHIPQAPQSLRRLAACVAEFDPFALTAFHDLVAISGSLIIGLAATREFSPVEALWSQSRIDEDWQSEVWGSDEEADAAAALKREAFVHAGKLFRICQG